MTSLDEPIPVGLPGFSIAIPAYSRPVEFEELLQSIYESKRICEEVIVCEDMSKERLILREIADKWKPILATKGCQLNYIENEVNLGYDGNVRKLIQKASFKWVMLMGNDDIILPNGLEILAAYCDSNPDVAMVSRPFLRFSESISQPLGLSRIAEEEFLIKQGKAPEHMLFRACAFVGGLVVNKNWAEPLHTTKYDGGLYYQIYLACHAYCTTGIGYLAHPTMGGRTGNPPLFGEAKAKHHIPGSYSPKARAKMWQSVLEMGEDVGKIYALDLYSPLLQELKVRQSFHIFEMNATASNKTLLELRSELKKLGLFSHWLPKSLFIMNRILGKKSLFIYTIARKFLQ